MDRLGKRRKELITHIALVLAARGPHYTDAELVEAKKQLRYIDGQATKDVRCLLEWSRYPENENAFLRKFENTYNRGAKRMMRAVPDLRQMPSPRGV